MAERLTKHGKTTHENGICCTHFSGEECVKLQGDCSNGCLWEEKVWEKLAHYEDLEEQGRLIELPCKVGDTVYYITGIHNTLIKPAKVEEVYFGDVFAVHVSTQNASFTLVEGEFFLTKEEAEAALKGENE